MRKTIRMPLLHRMLIFFRFIKIYICVCVFVNKIYEFKELILKNFEISSNNFSLNMQKLKINLNCWTSCQFAESSCINFHSLPSQNKKRKKIISQIHAQLFSRLETRHSLATIVLPSRGGVIYFWKLAINRKLTRVITGPKGRGREGLAHSVQLYGACQPKGNTFDPAL